jgi:hypothetical protein
MKALFATLALLPFLTLAASAQYFDLLPTGVILDANKDTRMLLRGRDFLCDAGWGPVRKDEKKVTGYRIIAHNDMESVRRIDLRFENGGLSWFAARTRETICCGVMRRYLHRVASLTAELGLPPESLRRFDSTAVQHNDERDIAEVKAGHAVISDHWQLPSRYPEVMSMAHTEITQKGEMLEWYLEKGVEGRMLEGGIK